MGSKLTVVHEYEKKDGTVIAEHRRRAPRERRSKVKQMIDKMIK